MKEIKLDQLTGKLESLNHTLSLIKNVLKIVELDIDSTEKKILKIQKKRAEIIEETDSGDYDDENFSEILIKKPKKKKNIENVYYVPKKVNEEYTNNTDDPMIDMQEISEMTGKKLVTVKSWVAQGKLPPSKRINRKLCWKKSKIEKFLSKNPKLFKKHVDA